MDETQDDAPIPEQPQPAPKNNPRTGRPWTDEEREAQSQLAKRLVAEGKMGGANQGKKRRLPAYAVVAATAQRNGKALADELLDIALRGANERVRMDAIKLLTDIEQKARQERREDEDHLQRLPRDQLLRAVLERISDLTGEDYDIDLPGDDVEDVGDEAATEAVAGLLTQARPDD